MNKTPANISSDTATPINYKFTGKHKVEKVKITVINYNKDSFTESEVTDISELINCRKNDCVSWINICGLHDTNILKGIGEVFNIHPLAVEDILNVHHAPKIEEFDDYFFIIAKMIDLTPAKLLYIEHVCFLLGEYYLITFQEDEDDVFNNIRKALHKEKSEIRNKKSDYLMYRLLDSMIDNYFTVTENFDRKIELLEDRILLSSRGTSIEMIHKLRKEIIPFRRGVNPLREVIFTLEKEKDKRIDKSTYYYLRDLNDHLKKIMDEIETYKDNLNNMVNMYLSNASHKMNEVIKFLTIISTIFIPLTFIVGIYGMNFNTGKSMNMPELNWEYGYFFIMSFMFIIAAGLVIYFKRKKWF